MNSLSPRAGSFIWGLPESAFDRSLVWYSALYNAGDPSRRRQQFPSWSWAGWRRNVPRDLGEGRDRVLYRRSIYACFWNFRFHAGVRWWICNPQTTYLSDLETADLREVLRSEHAVEDGTWVHPKDIPEPRPPLTHFLCFITTLKHLTLVRHHVSGDLYELQDRGNEHVLGKIWLSPAVVEKHGLSLDFIVVGQEEDPPTNYILMAIEWENGYAQRIELVHEKVSWEDWFATKPEKRIINLA